jgi:hypothetical protein
MRLALNLINPPEIPMTPEAHFRATAPKYMRRLVADFPSLNLQDAAAIFGNLGHESLGFTKLQEMKPTVAGSKGGWGWAQWTGPRRRAFEAYCKRNGKDPASDEANYAYLFVELKGIEGTESGAVGKVSAAVGLEAKVKAFEQAFLRAGVKHYDSRLQWAKIAVDALRKEEEAAAPVPQPRPKPSPTIHPHEPEPEDAIAPPPEKKGCTSPFIVIAALLVAIGLALIAFFLPLPI